MVVSNFSDMIQIYFSEFKEIFRNFFSGNDALWNEYFTQIIFVYVKFRKLHSMQPHALIFIHF